MNGEEIIMGEKETMLSTTEAAKRLGVGMRTIQLWLRQGRLPGVKLGPRIWRIRESDVLRIQQEGLPKTEEAKDE